MLTIDLCVSRSSSEHESTQMLRYAAVIRLITRSVADQCVRAQLVPQPFSIRVYDLLSCLILVPRCRLKFIYYSFAFLSLSLV